jgi:hypothetical protein
MYVLHGYQGRHANVMVSTNVQLFIVRFARTAKILHDLS